MNPEETKQLILEAKNIVIIPSEENKGESILSALALFYTLKELSKNVNLVNEKFPEKFNFLIPSLDFISPPKNFVISIPNSSAEVSQIYYEKGADSLKIHLNVEKGQVKKENLSFYFQSPKADLVITLGIGDIQKQLTTNLDSFGFILDAPIINIDNKDSNLKFGKINIIEQKSIAEITLNLIKSIDENLVSKNVADCILSGLVVYYDNFKSKSTGHEVFNLSADLMKKGASLHEVVNNLHKADRKESEFLYHIFQNLRVADTELSYSLLDSDKFHDFSEYEADDAVGRIRTIGIQNDLLVLWKSHNSNPSIKGFFYSKNPGFLNKISENQKNTPKHDWVFITDDGADIDSTKNKIVNLLS